MKRINTGLIIGILLFLSGSRTFSQSQIATYQVTPIEPYHLATTFLQTTNLIFPYAIKSVDRGSRDILVQKAKGVENVLLVKAGRENFKETNLTVITANGKLYSFLVAYSAKPSSLTFYFTEVASYPKPTLDKNEAKIKGQAEWIAREKKILSASKESTFKVQFQLKGLYIPDEVVFYPIEIKNQSISPMI